MIWEHLGLQASRSRVASLLGLRAVDRNTARAVEIALFNAFNTSAAIPDMETVSFALSSFIYAFMPVLVISACRIRGTSICRSVKIPLTGC